MSSYQDLNFPGRSNTKRMSSIMVHTRFGLRSYTIKPDSPRTKQAVIELGIDPKEFFLRLLNEKQ